MDPQSHKQLENKQKLKFTINVCFIFSWLLTLFLVFQWFLKLKLQFCIFPLWFSEIENPFLFEKHIFDTETLLLFIFHLIFETASVFFFFKTLKFRTPWRGFLGPRLHKWSPFPLFFVSFLFSSSFLYFLAILGLLWAPLPPGASVAISKAPPRPLGLRGPMNFEIANPFSLIFHCRLML